MNLTFKYQTTISEEYVDMICAKRGYQAVLKESTFDENEVETITETPNPISKYDFVAHEFTGEIDRKVVHAEFMEINKMKIERDAQIAIQEADARISQVIEMIRVVETTVE